jgi:hypothetical protein
MDPLVFQTRQPVHPHKILGTRYPRCSPDLYESQGGGISDPLGLLNNNSNGPGIAMNVSRKEGESDHWDLSGGLPVES